MITQADALARVLAQSKPLPMRRVSLLEALGSFLAQNVVAPEAIPRFDQSSMDGYGVRAEDVKGVSERTPALLRLIGEIRAGDRKARGLRKSLAPGETVRIFTGASIPVGVDTVVMKEFCRESAGHVLVRQCVSEGAHIRRCGEEFRKGQVVLEAGTRITPPVIGLLATVGCARPRVYRKPRVALVVTGNELRSPGERLKGGQIHDSNSFALAAALASLGIEPVLSARVRDDREAIRRQLAQAINKADVAIVVGGVSVGDYDFVKDAAAELGIQTVYWRVAIKPGMPNYLGTYSPRLGRRSPPRLVFGLPGNPVSALVSFHQFVRPALLRMIGASSPQPRYLQAILGAERRKKHDRLEWVRGVLSTKVGGGLLASPTGGQESHMLGGLARANCLIEFPADSTLLRQGEPVRVLPLEWSELPAEGAGNG